MIDQPIPTQSNLPGNKLANAGQDKARGSFYLWRRLKWLTPKKRAVYLGLPFLIVVAAITMYFILAAPGDPGVWLERTDGKALKGGSLRCNTQYDVDVYVSSDGSNQSGRGIVTAGAFVAYDPNLIEMTAIDASGSDFRLGEDNVGSGGVLQVIDVGRKLAQIIRGQPAPGHIPGPATSKLLLGTLRLRTKQTEGPASLRFYGSQSADPSDLRSMFILNGGASTGVNYDKDASGGVYEFTINCSQEVDLFLNPDKGEVGLNETFTVNVNMRPDNQAIDSANVIVNLTHSGASPSLEVLSAKANPALFPGIAGNTAAVVSGNKITFNIPSYRETNQSSVMLGSITFIGKAEGTTKITFDGTTSITLGAKNLFNPAYATGGSYLVIKPRIKLCPGSQVIVEPQYNSAEFHLCTVPDADCALSVSSEGGPDIPGDPSEISNQREHDFTVSGLNDTTTYTYNIVCARAIGDYNLLEINGSFKPLKVTNLEIKNLKVSAISASRATISWVTSGGANADGRADSYVHIAGAVQSSDLKVTGHGVDILGLSGDTPYIYYVSSSVDAPRGSCGSAAGPSATNKCAVSGQGTFRTLTVSEAPDANKLLKVNRDRICDEWLYCNAAVKVLDTKKNPPQYEDVCFDTGLCGAIDVGGKCVDILASPAAPMTKKQPEDVEQIRNLSGLSKAGLDWGYRCLNNGKVCDPGAPEVICRSGPYAQCVKAVKEGYYPYDMMNEIGLTVGLPNASFESRSVWPWQENSGAKISNVNDSRDRTNRVLKIEPKGAFSGARIAALSTSIITTTGSEYVISFRARIDNALGQNIAVELGPYGPVGAAGPDNNNYKRFAYFDKTAANGQGEWIKYLPLTNDWTEYVMVLSAGEIQGVLASDKLGILVAQDQAASLTNSAFYLDNVNMKKVLRVSESAALIARSCRMYPTQNAPACDYYDEQRDVDYKGWKGYCVETDPGGQEREFARQPLCLNWWPVDVISGESNVFAKDEVVGYKGRMPLYYCLEAPGNYSRCGKTHVVGNSKTICGSSYEVHNYYGAQAFDRCNYRVLPGDIRDYTFAVCRRGMEADPGDTSGARKMQVEGIKPTAPEYGLQEYEIEAVVLEALHFGYDYPATVVINRAKFGTSETIFGAEYQFKREVREDVGEIVWRVDALTKAETNRVKFAAIFDRDKGLTAFRYSGSDDTGTDPDKDIEPAYYVVKYYLREPCTKIARVVSPEGESTPWIDRLNSPQINASGWIGYQNKQDYAPFGSAVVPEPAADPEAWNLGEPLYVEPADNTFGLAPYQVRAGSPYARQKWDSTDWGICKLNADLACDSDSDCSGANGGECLGRNNYGNASCVAGSNIGRQCKTNLDCGINYTTSETGLCVGFSAPSGDAFQSKTFNYPAGMAGMADPQFGGEPYIGAGGYNLSRLFARSYGIWQWDAYAGKYVLLENGSGNPVDWDITASGKLPQVTGIWVDDSDTLPFVLVDQGSAILKFTSYVDPNQTPLTAYAVRWGDGSESSEAGLRIAGRGANNPHILVHYYKYDDNCKDSDNISVRTCDLQGNNCYCAFEPSVQLEDNWGQKSGWIKFKQEVRVYKEGSVFDPAALKITGSPLVYIDNPATGCVLGQNGHTDQFQISNAVLFGNDLRFRIDRVDGGGFLDNSAVKYTLNPALGYEGVLGPQESLDARLTVYNVGSLAVGEHTFNIIVQSLDEYSNVISEQAVSVELWVGQLPPQGCSGVTGSIIATTNPSPLFLTDMGGLSGSIRLNNQAGGQVYYTIGFSPSFPKTGVLVGPIAGTIASNETAVINVDADPGVTAQFSLIIKVTADDAYGNQIFSRNVLVTIRALN